MVAHIGKFFFENSLKSSRHMPDNQLAALLSSLQLNSSDVQDIVKTAKSGNYQIACQKHFDITHPGHLQMSLQVHS